MKFGKSALAPLASISNSWGRVAACKHWMDCAGLVNGNFTDLKGSVVAAPQAGYEFQVSQYGGIKSTAPGLAAREPLVSGSWDALPLGKSALFFYAGFLDADPNQTERTLRCAIGDANAGVGWGLSDGEGTSELEAHVIFRKTPGGAGQASGSYWNSPGLTSLGDHLNAQVKQGGHFFRYAIYRPDGLAMESRAYRTDTGALLAANDTVYIGAEILVEMAFSPLFRMHGSAQTAIGIFHFDAIPTDYLLAMHSMAAASRDGNAVVWPYWG